MAESPTLRIERQMLRSGARLVCGMDEVGRGALSGPVSVGAVVVDMSTTPLPGVRDSKLLSGTTRERLAPEIRVWAVTSAVGHAGADEIDEVGIIGALRRAGMRALATLAVVPDAVLLDGKHDWLTPPSQTTMFDEIADDMPSVPTVTTRVKADMTCLSVAAASVLAKTERDARMMELHAEFPVYRWDGNKGYGAPEHIDALRAVGPSPWHRHSWRLPGVDD